MTIVKFPERDGSAAPAAGTAAAAAGATPDPTVGAFVTDEDEDDGELPF